MPLQRYFDNLEPDDPEVKIWRFMPLIRFEDLIANEELHFCRADLFTQDETEGVPPETFVRRVMGLRPFDPADERTLIHQMGTLAQDREAFYVSCWHLFRHETMEMWQGFADTGVAVCSTYARMKSLLDGLPDMTHLGLVRYGEERLHQTGRLNVLQFINTKRQQFVQEREVRAIVWCPDPFAGGNRHFDIDNVPHSRPLPENPRHHWVPDFKRRRIDLKALVTGVVVSPWATNETYEIAAQWAKLRLPEVLARRSVLAIG